MRPLKYGEEMIRVDLRIPKSSAGAFKVLVKEFLKKYEAGGETTKSLPQEKKVIETTKPKWMLDAEERMKRNK